MRLNRRAQLAQLGLGLGLASLAVAAGAQAVQRLPYIVQLNEAPAAAYEGGIAGLAATRPAPGQRINVQAPAVQAYLRHVATKVDAVAATVPAANVYQRYGVVVSGFAAMLTPAELDQLTRTPGVRAITADEARKPDTSYTTSGFLGLAAPGGAWSQTDAAGQALKGEGVIIAMVDGGIWPENVSVSDKVGADGKPVPSYAEGTVVYDALPVGRYKGSCQAGEAFNATMCNNKLVGAQNFNATAKAIRPALQFVNEYDSPRDAGGHGTHTLTTAGGNANSDVFDGGTQFTLSGVAPRARLAVYKVCNQIRGADGVVNGSCFSGDSVAAIEKAVADGVNVINYSISGSQTSVNDIVEQAMKGATKAGVFVSMSAGNSGGNTVAHISPWVATVGNSTHDRNTEATVSLGGGATVRGASMQSVGLPATALIWSRDAGSGAVAAEPGSNLAMCLGATDGVPALLDPDKVRGKILVCDRGSNVLVNKVDNARIAGAVGVIILNRPAEGAVIASSNTTLMVAASLPLVHASIEHFAAVTAEARRAGGTAAFGPGLQVAGLVAPVMATSSSRGPNRGDTSIMKPDITAPGTDIIAGYVPDGLTVAERAELIAGTATGRQGANMISGTSMSAPHVAGAAALLRQARPTWSPSAIKSALMTSASQNVKLSSGVADTNRWGYGAGHLNPNAALATTVVYDITPAQYDAYNTGALPGANLNLPSLTAANIQAPVTLTRRLTNLGSAAVTLNAVMTPLAGIDTVVTPTTLTIQPGATAAYTVRFTRTTAPTGTYRFGSLTWSGSGQTLVSPVAARWLAMVVYNTLDETRATGSRLFTVGTGFSGTMLTNATGLVPATRLAGNVAKGKSVCAPFVIPAGAVAARVQMFNSETEGGAAADLDLEIRNAAGTVLAISESNTSNELISLTSPAAASYQACVVGFRPVGATANFVLNTWVVGPAVGAQTLKAAGPKTAYLGGMASVVASWSVAPGARYLGRIVYVQASTGVVQAGTTLFVDTTANAAALQAAAPVERIKHER